MFFGVRACSKESCYHEWADNPAVYIFVTPPDLKSKEAEE